MRLKQTQNGYAWSEANMVKQVTDFLFDQGYRVWHEIPNMGQSVDLIAMRGRYVTCIEAKKTDWKRALTQCRTHEHVADYICIAIGTVSISTSLLEYADNLGYGIIHCKRTSDVCDWVLKPRPNKGVWRPQRQRLETNLKDIEYVC